MRTILVGPGADERAGGDALLAAINSLKDASSTKPYLVKLEPGVYHLGTSTLQLKPYVDVEGSGEGVTKITSEYAPDSTVAAAGNMELRWLSVACVGTGAAIRAANADGLRLTHVTAEAVGAAGDMAVAAIQAQGGSLILRDVVARASANGGGATALILDGLQATVVGATVVAAGDSGPFGKTAILIADTLVGKGVNISLDGIDARVLGPGLDSALRTALNDAVHVIDVRNSTLVGDPAVPGAVALGVAIANAGTASIRVANTWTQGLLNKTETGGGTATLICLDSYDANFAPLPGTCM